MADDATPGTGTTAPATPPAANGGTDVAELVKAAVDAAMKPVLETVAGLQKGQEALQEAAAKAIGPEDVAKAVQDAVAAQTTAQAATDAKKAFIAEKLKGVPAAYHGKLGDDPAKWAAEEQAIRAELKSDLAAMGVTAPDLDGGAAAAEAATPAATVDTSKLTGQQLMEIGLKTSKPVGPAEKAEMTKGTTA